MLSTTDDLRIRELKELSTPEDVMREVPRTLTATRVVMAARNAIHAILNGQDDRLLVVVGPCSVHDPKAALEYAERLASLREELSDQLEIVMRVYFEKPRTTVGWKGLINDPGSGRQLRHQQGPAARAQRALGHQQSRPARRRRIPGHDDAAIHRRPRVLGCDRRAHDREPDPSRAGLGAVLPGRVQERHRRQCAHRSRRGEVGLASASFHGGDEARPFGDRLDRGQRGLPHHPARRQPSRTTMRQASRRPATIWRNPASRRW